MTYNFYDEYSIARNQFHNKQFPSEYLDDILVRLAYHSSAIEGNTISLIRFPKELHYVSCLKLKIIEVLLH